MARLFSFRPAMTIKGRKFKGLRGWAGKPFHPPLTDFPIVCYVLAATFDLISYLKYGKGSGDVAHDFFVSATHAIIAGAIVSLSAIVTGFWDWWKGVERDRSTGVLGRAKHTQVWRTINAHAIIMVTTTVVVLIDIWLRLSSWDEGYTEVPVLALSLLAGTLVSVGAAYGGSLVYDYQFNVESIDGTTVWDETEVDQLPGSKQHP